MTTQPLQQAQPSLHHNSLAQLIEQTCLRFGEHSAFSCRGVSLSFSQLERESRAFAAYLQHHTGLQQGDRIALQLPNCLQYVIAAFGALRAGLVLVNTNPQYTEPELIYQFNDAGVTALVVISDLLPGLAKVIKNTPVTTIISTHLNDLQKPLPQPKTALNTIEFTQLLRQGHQLSFTAPNLAPTDLALLQYTGGTTGFIKAAMLSHSNVLANLHQCSRALEGVLEDGREQLLTPLPIYHIYAFVVHLLYFSHGAHSTLLPLPRNLEEVITSFARAPITAFAGISTLFKQLCQSSRFSELDFRSLKLTLAGATSLQQASAEQWQQVTGCAVSQGYGLTEASPVVTLNLAHAPQLSVGQPLRNTELKLVDDNDQEVKQGDCGELLIKGPQVMQGYWRQPQETALVLTQDGYLRTGDIAQQDEHGNLYIVDRKKDIIIVSGVNVYPTEVEAVLNRHPQVADCAVFSAPNERTGEQVQARIVLKQAAAKEHREEMLAAELYQFCEEQLAPYKIPKVMQFESELPVNHVGKLLRRQLANK